MSWHRLAAMARKEVIQIVRDLRSLIIVVLLPVIMMLLFGYGVTLDMRHIPIIVLDQDGTQASQDLLKRFEASDYFRITGVARDYPELLQALDAGRARMAFVVPYDFSERLRTGGSVAVQALVDASDDNTANVVFGYTEGVVRGYSQEIQMDWVRHRTGSARLEPPISIEARTWYNEDLLSSAFIVPGVLALVMAVIGAFLTSLTIAREWERGTMEQLVSTPVTSLEIMLGKLGPYFVIGMVDTALCAAIGVWWFQVPFRGSVVTLLLASSLFLIAMLSLGYFLSVVAKTQLAASQLALIVTFLPAFLLSGFLFAIEQMPPVIQYATRIIPARYYVAALKSIFLKGSGISRLQGELVPLAALAAILATIATRAFHKRLD